MTDAQRIASLERPSRRVRKIRLTEEEYRRLRAIGVGCRRIAKMFGCSETSVCELARRRGWRQ